MKEKKIHALTRIKAAVGGAIAGWIGGGITLADGGFWSKWFGLSNFSGKRVTVNSALQISTVMACVRLISEVLSTLPVGLFYKGEDGAPVAATEHQLYYLLHSQPNATMTAPVFWQALIASLLLQGKAYVEKRMSAGVITSLEFLITDQVSNPRRLASGALEWSYNDPVTKTTRIIPESRMWHLPAFTLDGINGISPVSYGANIFGAAIAADQASAETFTNGMKATGLVMMDAVLTEAQREEMRAHVKTVSDNGGVMVMEKGSGYQQLRMNPQDAELLSTRSFNIEEICRWFRVDPSLVAHGSKDSNWGTGLEEKMTWFVTLVLRPWAVKIESGIKKDLLSPVERRKFSAEFALEGLLRGDSKARAAFYAQMTQNGVMTRDECRRLENLAPLGGNAAVLTVQSNMLPIDKLGNGGAAGSTAKNALLAWLDQPNKKD